MVVRLVERESFEQKTNPLLCLNYSVVGWVSTRVSTHLLTMILCLNLLHFIPFTLQSLKKESGIGVIFDIKNQHSFILLAKYPLPLA